MHDIGLFEGMTSISLSIGIPKPGPCDFCPSAGVPLFTMTTPGIVAGASNHGLGCGGHLVVQASVDVAFFHVT